MTDVGAATPDGPARRRESWSLKNLVEDIAGKPIGELQDPDRPMHPYLKVKGGGAPAPRRTLGLSAASAVYGAGPAHAVAEVEPVPIRSTGSTRPWSARRGAPYTVRSTSITPPPSRPSPRAGTNQAPGRPTTRPGLPSGRSGSTSTTCSCTWTGSTITPSDT